MVNFPKSIFIFTFVLFFSIFIDTSLPQESRKSFVRFEKPKINFALLESRENLDASIVLKKVPGGLFLNGDEADSNVVEWNSDIICTMRYGKKPGNRNLNNYPNTIGAQGSGLFTLNPYIEGMTTGIYFCILISVEDTSQTSVEFKVIVQSERAPLPRSPKGLINLQKNPEFKWDTVPGVAYYFLFLSEGKMSIKRNEKDEITGLDGLNLTWQVITPDNIVEYGKPDPTGNFINIYMPPLLPGVDYNWLVLNSYGPDTDLVSGEVAPLVPENFMINRPELSAKPSLVQPENDVEIMDDEILFRWTAVAEASRYRIFLYETTESFGNIIDYILWSQVTSNTQIRLKAKNLLVRTDYHWRVVAEKENKISNSERRHFIYNGSAGWAKFKANSVEGVLSRVTLEIENEANASLFLPNLTDSTGIKIVALPTGSYRFIASKPGFLSTQQVQFSVAQGDTKFVNIQLQRSLSTISGQIVDISEAGVFDATVQLKSGNIIETVKSDDAGYFKFSVNSGNWSIRAYKPGFVTTGFQSISFLQDGEARDVGAITLNPATNTVDGSVVFAADGRSLPGAFVRAQKNEIEFETTTDNQGKFNFSLGPGTWKILLDSQGFFATPTGKTFVLADDQQKSIAFQLYSGGLIYGKINFQNRGVPGAEIQAYHKETREFVQSVTSNIQGNYSLGIRDTGGYELMVSHASYLPKLTDVTIIQGQTLVKDFTLVEAGFVAGTVRHANTFAPLENVEVFAVEDSTNMRTSTDTDGFYILSLPPGQNFNISAAFPGFEMPGPYSITTTAGDTSYLQIQLKPLSSASISGKVVNDSSLPIEGATLEIVEERIQTITNANGYFEFSDLQPGNYTLQVRKECHIDKTITLSLSAGDRKEINISLEELRSIISGAVKDMRGDPIEDARVEAVEIPLTMENYTNFTDYDGNYELCLKGGQFRIVASHPGFLNSQRLLSINDGERKDGIDFALEDNFAIVTGFVKDTSDIPVSQVEVILANDNQKLRDISGSNGLYLIDKIYPGTSKIKADKDGFFGKTKTLNLVGQMEINLDLILFPEDGSVSGTVRDTNDSSPISGVTIAAAFSEDSEKFYSDTTDFSGNYILSKLPVVPNATFTISAFKNGYVSQQDVFSGVLVNTVNLDFYLTQPNAIITGTVQDVDTGEPLDSVKVVRSGSTSEIFTNEAGQFVLTELMSGENYALSVSKPGFFPLTVQNVSAGDTNVVIKILRRYAFVIGKVTDTEGTEMSNVEIHAVPEQNGRENYTTTDESGGYLLKLIADTYHIRPIKISHRSKPNSIQVQLSEDSTVAGIDFTLFLQELQFINISGESEISNQSGSICFDANPKDVEGIDIVNFGELDWSVNVSDFAATINSEGCLEINPNYFGELTVTATDQARGIDGNLEVEVFATIDSATNTVLFDDRGLQMVINKRSVPTGVNLLVSKKPVAPAKKGRASYFTTDSSYVIKPVGMLFNGDSDDISDGDSKIKVVNSPIKLRLPPPPDTEGQRRFIAQWDDDNSEWLLLGTSEKEDNLLEANILETGEYIALSISKTLAIDNLSLRPNPFSPSKEIDRHPGLKIQFDVSSRSAPNPLLTLKIYNLEGNLVRNLHDQTPFNRGPAIVYWDGKTDNGTFARNGRYLVRLVLEDPAESKTVMKSVVLIK